ncbi:DNA polymerase I, thermostable [compost metagenome]
MSRLLNPKRLVPHNCPNKAIGPHSIEAWGWRVGRGKPEHNDWEHFSEDMLHRCSEDVEIQDMVYNELMKEAAGGDWKNAFLLTFKLFENLQKQEAYGWLVNQDHMHFCVRQLTKWVERIDRVITPYLPKVLEIEETKKDGEYNYVRKPFLKSGEYSKNTLEWISSCDLDHHDRPVCGSYSRISFRTTDLNSNAETKDFLLNLGWEPLEWNTNDAGERTSPKLSKDDPFEGIDGKVGKLVAKRVQCRHRRSTIEGLFNLIREDGRIPSVVNTLAVTGRATHRNIVNIPKAGSFFGNQMRTIFTCAEGNVLVGTDSDANQIRMLCGRMNDPEYTNNVLNGKKEDGSDIHSVNMRAAGLPNRDAAKTFFYGFLFGAGDAKVGKIVKGNSADGRRLKEQFLKGLPALGALMEKLQKEWRKTAKQRYNPKFGRMEYYNGKITGLDGRPIVVPSEHQVLVYLLQSDEAIHMTAAYNLMWKRLSAKYEYGKDFGIVCFYHDEATVECRKEIAEDVKSITEQCIVDAAEFFKISCPHKGNGAIGKNWYAIH